MLTYYEQFERGNQILCQCDYEVLQTYFEGIAHNFSEDRFGAYQFASDIDLPEEFYFDNCLAAHDINPVSPASPYLEKLLNNQLPPTQAIDNELLAQVNGQLMIRQDGNWILDLAGQLPDSLELLEVLKPQLYHLRSSDYQYYPAVTVAPWKAKLITNGHASNQLVGYNRATIWKEELGNHRAMSTIDPNHWNVQYMLAADTHIPTDAVEAAGYVQLMVTNGSTEVLAEPFTYFEAENNYVFELDEKGTLYISDAAQGEGFRTGLAYYPNSRWVSATFLKENGDTVAHFTPAQQPLELEFRPLPGQTYFVHLVRQKQIQVKVPFTLSMPGETLDPGFSIGEMYSQRYRFSVKHDGQHRISAVYDIYTPHHSGQDSFTLERAYDNTGKDLLLHQADSIDAYNESLAALGEDRYWWERPIEDQWKKGFSWGLHADAKPSDHYHLEIGLWEKPAAKASQIYLEGLLHYQTPDGNWATHPWQDTLQLSTSQTATAAKIEESIQEMTSLSAYEFKIGGDGPRNTHNLQAKYALAVPLGHNYVKMDMQQSQLTQLQDNTGKNLLLAQAEAEAMQYELNKRMKEPRNMDRPFLTLRPDIRTYRYGEPMSQVNFNVYSHLAPGPGAHQVQGKATIAYYTAADDDLTVAEQTITYEKQEQISLEVAGHIVHFKRSAFTDDIDDKTYVHYQLAQEDLSVLIAANIILDGEEEISPNPMTSQFSLYDLRIPEDVDKRPLTIRLLYAELQLQIEQVDVEVSIHGTIHN